MKLFYRRKWFGKPNKLLFSILLLSLLLGGCGEIARQAALEEVADPALEAGGQTVEYINGIPMDENAAVVTVSAADVYREPDVKSLRVTQVLCNQPVSVVSSKNGWSRVKTVSGITGWIKSKFISDDVSSISGRVYLQDSCDKQGKDRVFQAGKRRYHGQCSYGDGVLCVQQQRGRL